MRSDQLCQELAAIQNEGGIFIVSTLQVKDLLDCSSRMQAQRKLRSLIALQAIELVRSGNSKYANTYRYKGLIND